MPVAISLGLLRKAMEASGPRARFLIDGFPRNRDNVEARTSEPSNTPRPAGQCYSMRAKNCCIPVWYDLFKCVCWIPWRERHWDYKIWSGAEAMADQPLPCFPCPYSRQPTRARGEGD